jgi:ribonuclease T2
MKKLAWAAALLCLAAPARAEIKLSGTLTAAQACPALQSIRSGANPGEVALEPGRAYRLLAKNRDDATHYLVEIEGASPPRRWVGIGCGTADAGAAPPAQARAGDGGGARASHILALSWQAGFCATHPAKTECAAPPPPPAPRLTLHGLWPQPRGKSHCGVPDEARALDRAATWNRLPAPEMTPQTRARLAAVMPGVQSSLDRHEWIAHGTCYGASAEAYFARSASLAEQANATGLPAFFARNAGKTVTAQAIRAAVDEALGPGAGERVLVACEGKGPGRLIGEIRLSLAGDVQGEAALRDLVAAAAPSQPGCPSGLVMPAR